VPSAFGVSDVALRPFCEAMLGGISVSIRLNSAKACGSGKSSAFLWADDFLIFKTGFSVFSPSTSYSRLRSLLSHCHRARLGQDQN